MAKDMGKKRGEFGLGCFEEEGEEGESLREGEKERETRV